ncbi:unnamed protein product [Moneuplotes crassus]|uniref:Uncharacterized protein n=1 Tax=Euplotes crassus TaxID=5936 RepID=A0AAD1Y7D9_EUPCR|nr:unnamed protein product [Moneuplotes crassus]
MSFAQALFIFFFSGALGGILVILFNVKQVGCFTHFSSELHHVIAHFSLLFKT